MKVLITGGTGFLGKRVIPALVGKGHEVYALTRSESSTIIFALWARCRSPAI
jgi:uncharacterized protein YbjT (DUF2867 family)